MRHQAASAGTRRPAGATAPQTLAVCARKHQCPPGRSASASPAASELQGATALAARRLRRSRSGSGAPAMRCMRWPGLSIATSNLLLSGLGPRYPEPAPTGLGMCSAQRARPEGPALWKWSCDKPIAACVFLPQFGRCRVPRRASWGRCVHRSHTCPRRAKLRGRRRLVLVPFALARRAEGFLLPCLGCLHQRQHNAEFFRQQHVVDQVAAPDAQVHRDPHQRPATRREPQDRGPSLQEPRCLYQ